MNFSNRAGMVKSSLFAVRAASDVSRKFPYAVLRKKRLRKKRSLQKLNNCIFYHPDFTVGFGISPNRPPQRFADFTAGRELHPTPKILYFVCYDNCRRLFCQLFFNCKVCPPGSKRATRTVPLVRFGFRDVSPPGKKGQNITGLPLGSKEPHQVESHGTHQARKNLAKCSAHVPNWFTLPAGLPYWLIPGL